MLIQDNIPSTVREYEFKHLTYPYQPFKHQAQVFESIFDNDILLESPTSSGKTAAVVYPIVDFIADNQQSRAIFVYPTRALLWDQHRVISNVGSQADLTVAKLDPFTPTKDLYEVFAQNRLIVMTPDIFYYTLLRNAQHYKRFFERSVESVAHIVFDEVHLYDTYMLFNLRHLLKIIRYINPEIRIHCLSATLDHVKQHFQNILDFKVITGESFTGEVEIKSIFMPMLEINSNIEKLLKEPGRKILILNSAKRAQEIFDQLKKAFAEVFFVVGSRYQVEKERNQNLEQFNQSQNGMLVASPLVEQGVDFQAKTMISEDPYTLFSIIQRFGRVGRGGVAGQFTILSRTAQRHDFYNQNQTLSRGKFENLLEDSQGGCYYNPPLPEEVKMMEAMLYKLYTRTQMKDSFAAVNDIKTLQELYEKYEKFLPDLSFREPSPAVELRSGNMVSVWDVIRKDAWRRLCPSNDQVTIGYLPIEADEFLRSEFIKYTPSIKLKESEIYKKGKTESLITGTFEIRGVVFKANGVLRRGWTMDAYKVTIPGFRKHQNVYFEPKNFFENTDIDT